MLAKIKAKDIPYLKGVLCKGNMDEVVCLKCCFKCCVDGFLGMLVGIFDLKIGCECCKWW